MIRTAKELRTKKSILLLLILIGGLAVFSIILYPRKANSGPYLNSTHGNSTYGVNRNSISAFGYPRGHCSHCHEQHASIGGSEPQPTGGPDQFLLFSDSYTSQTDNFCIKCHTETGSYQTGGLVNRSYSYRAGGYSSDSLNDILEAFSFCYSGCSSPSSSSHNLDNIKSFINGKWNYTSDSNPCNACHNPHAAIGDPANAPNSDKSFGTRGYSPVSRPSLHSKETSVWGLWGDVAAERMNVKANALGGIYQSPLNGSSSYEPDGSSTEDGANLTDFVTFCTDCHNESNTIITSHSLFNPSTGAMGRNELFKINWTSEHHGGYAITNYCSLSGVSLLASPYDGLTNCGKHVLSCTDCHEPHGSTNNYLVRTWVNNGFNDCRPGSCAVPTPTRLPVTVTNYGTDNGPDGLANKEWVYLCGKCHTNLNHGDAHTHPIQDYNDDDSVDFFDCLVCHPNGGDYVNCGDCHYHGSTYAKAFPELSGNTRPLF
jgi:hypothetical protein